MTGALRRVRILEPFSDGGDLLMNMQKDTQTNAVCLTGQLRGTSLNALHLKQKLLLPLGADVFYAGPLDEAFDMYHSSLRTLPKMKAFSLYNRTVLFGNVSNAEEVLKIFLDQGLTMPQYVPTLQFNINELPRFRRCNSKRDLSCPGLISFIMQSFQWQASRGMILKHEHQLGFEYQSILRTRPDVYFTSVLHLANYASAPPAAAALPLPPRAALGSKVLFVGDFLQVSSRDVMMNILSTFTFLLSTDQSSLPDLLPFM